MGVDTEGAQKKRNNYQILLIESCCGYTYYVKLFIYKENNLCSPLQLQLIFLFDFFWYPLGIYSHLGIRPITLLLSQQHILNVFIHNKLFLMDLNNFCFIIKQTVTKFIYFLSKLLAFFYKIN